MGATGVSRGGGSGMRSRGRNHGRHGHGHGWEVVGAALRRAEVVEGVVCSVLVMVCTGRGPRGATLGHVDDEGLVDRLTTRVE